MPLLRNRIGISLLLILLSVLLWEFHAKPVTGPLYAAAVNEYQKGQYEKSPEFLRRAYRIDPNNTSVLTLLGWNSFKTGKPLVALDRFSRAHRLAPHSPDIIPGYAETEIVLGHYLGAEELLAGLNKLRTDSDDVAMAWGSLYRYLGCNRDVAGISSHILAFNSCDAEARTLLKRPKVNCAASSGTEFID